MILVVSELLQSRRVLKYEEVIKNKPSVVKSPDYITLAESLVKKLLLVSIKTLFS